MGSFSIWHWLIVLAVILVLFGGGNKISGLMGDFAKGIKVVQEEHGRARRRFDGRQLHQSPAELLRVLAPKPSATNREPSTTH